MCVCVCVCVCTLVWSFGLGFGWVFCEVLFVFVLFSVLRSDPTKHCWEMGKRDKEGEVVSKWYFIMQDTTVEIGTQSQCGNMRDVAECFSELF